MISTASVTSESPIILDITSSNWAPYKKQILRILQTKFGLMGAAIVSGTAPTVHALPKKDDLNADGSPTFHRIDQTAAQVVGNIAADLSAFGYNMLPDAITRSLDLK
jgi:hypothetical protein